MERISDPGKELKVLKDFQRSEILFFFFLVFRYSVPFPIATGMGDEDMGYI